MRERERERQRERSRFNYCHEIGDSKTLEAISCASQIELFVQPGVNLSSELLDLLNNYARLERVREKYKRITRAYTLSITILHGKASPQSCATHRMRAGR